MKKQNSMDIKEVREKVKGYKRLKADLIEIDIAIKEAEENYIGITACPQEERTSPTYKITSTVENQAEKHQEAVEKLLHVKFIKENQVKRINNALSVLDDIHRYVIEEAVIKGIRYYNIECELHLGYRRVKQLEEEALRDMKKYIK